MKNVTIYITPTCHFCKDAKAFFETNEIPYKSVDVAADPMVKAHMIERSGQMGVPVIIIDRDVVIGFNKAKLSELLGIKDEKHRP